MDAVREEDVFRSMVTMVAGTQASAKRVIAFGSDGMPLAKWNGGPGLPTRWPTACSRRNYGVLQPVAIFRNAAQA